MRDRKDIDEDLQDAGDNVARLVVEMVRLSLQNASEHKARISELRRETLLAQARQYRLMAELAERCAATGEPVSATPKSADPFACIEIPDTFNPEDFE